jgi:hypothetical protein
MRKALDLDHLLENAVATALGLEKPHPELPAHIRPMRRRKLVHRQHGVAAPRREHRRAAA